MIRIRFARTLALGALLALAASAPARAQERRSSTIDDFDPRFHTLDLAPPNAYRTANGEPGPAYWQQRADYDIEATLDAATGTITGSETITYGNGSPDTLAFVWVQLDQNLFAPGSEGAQTFPAEARFGGGGFEGGYRIARVANADGAALEHRIVDTRMRVELARPLPPGGTTEIAIDWSFRVPETGADRMGRDGDHYVIAQWYPRMAVYDDVDGWNTLPYLGQGEFYLEYGDFDVALTVPAGWIVGATGALVNAAEVLTAEQRARLDRARTSAEVVQVVPEAEAGAAAGGGTATWRFRAENVRDVAWGTGPRLVWDATSADGALVSALYRPDARAWREAAAMTRHSILFYSELLGDYPYPSATAIEGPVYGMEYPMVVFVAPEEGREDLFDVLDHEWGHMWFPMIVGTDERRHAWMDEGFNTFANQFSKKAYFPQSDSVLLEMANYAAAIRSYREQPMATWPDRFAVDIALGIGAYTKPAVMLNALRSIVGAESFDEAFRDYVRVWAYKHPTPSDFFRFMEDRTGYDLGPFWWNWVYTTGTSDVAILGQDQNQAGDRWVVVVTVDQRGDLVMPARVVARTANGQTAEVLIPAEAFYGSDRAAATLVLPARATRIAVNEGPAWGDVNPQNNVWGK